MASRSASCQQHQHTASVVDDVQPGFAGGSTGLVVFGSRLHPDVFHAGGDRFRDDLTRRDGRRDDRERFGNERKIGNGRVGPLAFDLAGCRVEWIDFAAGIDEAREGLCCRTSRGWPMPRQPRTSWLRENQ